MDAPPSAGLRAIDPSGFRLVLERADVPAGSGLDAVELDRRLRPFGGRWGVPLGARAAKGLHSGFQFDREDSRTKRWYPQGIDGDGRRMLVSWYARDTGAARLSVIDPEGGCYGHVALVTADGKPIRTHAGGLAWRGDFLYVADTKRGLRLFDLTRFQGARLPQAGRYKPAGEPLRFSFASVDHEAGGLLVGEYLDKSPGARLARWPFAPDGLLAQETASDAWITGHINLQGAAVLGGNLILARSRGPIREGSLYLSPFAERSQRRRWAVGGEDLAAIDGELISLTEHPDLCWPLMRRRAVFRASGP